jgi:hypothetical protein
MARVALVAEAVERLVEHRDDRLRDRLVDLESGRPTAPGEHEGRDCEPEQGEQREHEEPPGVRPVDAVSASASVPARGGGKRVPRPAAALAVVEPAGDEEGEEESEQQRERDPEVGAREPLPTLPSEPNPGGDERHGEHEQEDGERVAGRPADERPPADAGRPGGMAAGEAREQDERDDGGACRRRPSLGRAAQL